jgi:prevent-host-death family protein
MSPQSSAPVTIPATKAHREFGALIRQVFSGEEHYIVERDGLPVAVILSVPEYEALVQAREHREQRLERFRQLAREIGEEFEREGISEAEMNAALEQTKRQVYGETYGKPPAAE